MRFDDAEGSVYLVAPDGLTLASIGDEMTFLANGFDWRTVEPLPAARRREFVIIDDANREAKRQAGLILFDTKKPPAVPVQVLSDLPTETRLHVRNEAKGYLVLDRAHFPGWHAEVNGVDTPIVRANFAFAAIPLPVGELDIRISYQPASLTRGAWIGLACLILGLGSLFRFRAAKAA